MARTPSEMIPLGSPLPAFELPDTDGALVSSSDFKEARALLVCFICNHCPFVVHLRAALAAFAREYQGRGVAVIAISSNDVERYPQDGPEAMRAERLDAGYSFPYLYDESQAVAHAFQARCTPDFFLYGARAGGVRSLLYRGEFDESRPGNGRPVTGAALRAACNAVLADTPVPAPQRPSLGCNIKWRPGQSPEERVSAF
ncbi:MAG: thioredoxin family protein [Myxococcota bacterium]|nr:thioredoxin family protein [Myxococcota bacterium]